jgi:hypothetical protein
VSDIKLFRIAKAQATELIGEAYDLEKPLQNLIESNLETLLGVRFLATEYSTGRTHAGRIDSLGIASGAAGACSGAGAAGRADAVDGHGCVAGSTLPPLQSRRDAALFLCTSFTVRL